VLSDVALCDVTPPPITPPPTEPPTADIVRSVDGDGSSSKSAVTVQVNPDGSLTISGGLVVWTVSAAGSVSAVLGVRTDARARMMLHPARALMSPAHAHAHIHRVISGVGRTLNLTHHESAMTPPRPLQAAQLVMAGPSLMVLGIQSNDFSQLTEANDRSYVVSTDPLANWTSEATPTYVLQNGSTTAVVTIEGRYPDAASGKFELTFDADGGLQTAFHFVWGGATVNVRQLGVVYDLPQMVDKLSWERRGQFSYYSPHDIGRNVGSDVEPMPCNDWLWEPGFSGGECGYTNDARRYGALSTPMGSNDFRSTKDAIITYSLCTQLHRAECVWLRSNGTQNGLPGTLSARAWLHGNTSIRMLAATLSNEGGNSFTQPIAVLPHQSVTVNTVVAGVVQMQIGP
jgi:hypothetical protein